MTPALLSFLTAALLQTAPQNPPPGFWEQPTMIGDLGGVRPAPGGAGVTFTLALPTEALSNVQGGLERNSAADMILDWVIDADLNKAVGWSGGSARINPMWIAGTGISDDVGDLTRVSNVTAEEGVRVFEAWGQQTLFDGGFSIRAGILAMDQEFALSSSGALFFNSACGAPIFASANLPVPIYPVGALGARARVDVAKGVYFQAGLFDGDPGTESFNRTGFRLRLTDEEGLFTIVEAGLTFGEDLPTVLKAGGFHHTADVASGGYVVLEQKLSRALGVEAYLRVGAAEEAQASVALAVDSGITITGLIPGRAADVLGIAFIYARISRDFAKVQPDRERWGHETVIEVTYKITLTPWLMVQPDLQVVVHPGGSTSIPDAVVLGIRLDVLF